MRDADGTEDKRLAPEKQQNFRSYGMDDLPKRLMNPCLLLIDSYLG